jgi:hypothetical protein
MIHILHVIDSLDLGGAQTALLNLIQPCDCAVFHHEVAAMHGRGMFADAFESAGIPVHSLSARRCPPAYVWQLPALLRRGSFDVVHCHLFGANWVAKPIAFFCGCRVIYNHDQCNDAFRNESRLVTWIDAQMNRFRNRSADTFNNRKISRRAKFRICRIPLISNHFTRRRSLSEREPEKYLGFPRVLL